MPTFNPEIIKQIIKAFPFAKLTRHDATNLLFDLMALFFTYRYALKIGAATPWSFGLFLVVILLSLACVMWASKQ